MENLEKVLNKMFYSKKEEFNSLDAEIEIEEMGITYSPEIHKMVLKRWEDILTAYFKNYPTVELTYPEIALIVRDMYVKNYTLEQAFVGKKWSCLNGQVAKSVDQLSTLDSLKIHSDVLFLCYRMDEVLKTKVTKLK